MGFRAAVLGLAALLAGCEVPAPAGDPPPDPIEEEAAAPPVAAPEPIPAPPMVLPPPPRARPVSDAGLDLIIDFEVGGRQAYDRRYTRPVCPACATTASGVTIGIGYDLRHQREHVILEDWVLHPQRADLPQGSGIGGQQAIALTRAMQHVVTLWPLAFDVFAEASIIEYHRRALRCYPGLEHMPQGVIDALASLTYNRGCPTGMVDRGIEARHIRDQCIPARDAQCVAQQIRAMQRIWAGSQIANGMSRRRNAEAALAAQ